MADCILFTRTGLHIPMGWALFWVTSTSVIHKKDDFMSGTRHSPMVTREKLQGFIPFLHMFLRLLNLITLEGTPQPMGSYALFQGLIASLLTCLWLRHDFHCYSHVFENLVNRTISSDHAAVRLVIHKPKPIGSNRANAFQVGCPSHLLFYSEAASRRPPIFCRSI